jgi:hypothetical protein
VDSLRPLAGQAQLAEQKGLKERKSMLWVEFDDKK